MSREIKLRHAALAAVLAACAARPVRPTVGLQGCIGDVERISREVSATRSRFQEALRFHLKDVSEILQHLNTTQRDAANVSLAIDARGRLQVIRDLMPMTEPPSPNLLDRMQRLNRMYETLHNYIESSPGELRPRPPLPRPPPAPNTTTRRRSRRLFWRRV